MTLDTKINKYSTFFYLSLTRAVVFIIVRNRNSYRQVIVTKLMLCFLIKFFSQNINIICAFCNINVLVLCLYLIISDIMSTYFSRSYLFFVQKFSSQIRQYLVQDSKNNGGLKRLRVTNNLAIFTLDIYPKCTENKHCINLNLCIIY